MPIRKTRDSVTGEVVQTVYQLRPQKTAGNARRRAVLRVRDHFMMLLQSDFPDITDMEEARRVLGSIVRAVIPAARSPELTLGVSRFVYGSSKIGEIGSMSEAEANAYNPTTDPGWPS